MVSDFRKALDAAAIAAGWKAGEIHTKMFRHSYCSARLQTLDRGAPVSVFTVSKELGQSGDALVKRVYGHLGQVRHRADVVEYRVVPNVLDTTTLQASPKSLSRP
jgi:integrase